jgi:Pro-kumamolisin, activation domain
LKTVILVKRSRTSLAIAAVFALWAIFSAAACTSTAELGSAGEPMTRLGVNHPTNVDLKHDLPVPRDKVLDLQVDFAMHNQAEFDRLSREIDDKKSPMYHHWLTPREVHARFGETAEQFHAVEAWLESSGFTITRTSYGGNADYIQFKGTVSQVEDAFKIKLVQPMYDRYINSEDPAIPQRFVGVISTVSGLYGLLK